MNRLLDENTIKTSMYSTLVLSYICFLNIAITDGEGISKYLIIFLSIFFIWYGCKKLYNMFKGGYNILYCIHLCIFYCIFFDWLCRGQIHFSAINYELYRYHLWY